MCLFVIWIIWIHFTQAQISLANYSMCDSSNWWLCVSLWVMHCSCCRCRCCCCYLCAWLRLMWWNPHGEMMCSAEGWQSRGEGLTVLGACWTTYMFRTTAPVCQHSDSTNPLCSHYLPEFFFSSFFSPFGSCSVANFAAAAVYPCMVFMSHITHLIFVCCFLEHESYPLWVFKGQWFTCCKGKEELQQFHSCDLGDFTPTSFGPGISDFSLWSDPNLQVWKLLQTMVWAKDQKFSPTKSVGLGPD